MSIGDAQRGFYRMRDARDSAVTFSSCFRCQVLQSETYCSRQGAFPLYLWRQVRGLRSKMFGVVDALSHRQQNRGGKKVAVVVVFSRIGSFECRACVASDA